MPITYKYPKWDKEKIHSQKAGGIEIQKHNIHSHLERYKNPAEMKKLHKFCPSINDLVSLYYLLGHDFRSLAEDEYLINNDCQQCAGNLFLYLSAHAKAYDNEKEGITITNSSIQKAIHEKKNFEHLLYTSIALNETDMISGHINSDSVLYSLFCKDYDKASELLKSLQDNIVVSNEVYYEREIYLKSIFTAILESDEKAFNSGLLDRIKKLRKNISGYLTIVDVTSIALIKTAAKRGIKYTLNIIEIPEYFLEDTLDFNKENFKLPVV